MRRLMNAKVPDRLLIVRPDAYGDIVLFEPVLRLLREAWPNTEITVLIQERYADITPLVGSRIRWLTTQYNPYREGADANPAALELLRRDVADFAPDCLVAACYDKTWMEAVVASFVPTARQVSLGAYQLDVISKLFLRKTVVVDWSAIFPEVVSVDPGSLEWEKNLQLARHLTGHEPGLRRPQLTVLESACQNAKNFLRDAALGTEGFAACCPAGVAMVSIKAWPTDKYGEILGWLEKVHRIRSLLLGHEKERDILLMVQRAARSCGADPTVWMGNNGEIAMLAALLQQSRFYFGNDTGALHMAGALNRPVVSVFGGGTWPRFKPAAERAAYVVQPLPCFGCGWECYFGDAPCLKTIPTDPIKKAITDVLSTTGPLQAEIIVENDMPATTRELIANVTAVMKARHHLRVGAPDNSTESVSRAALETLLGQLEFSEADRAARLAVIQQQGKEIANLLQRAGQPSQRYEALLEGLSKLNYNRNKLLAEFEKTHARPGAVARQHKPAGHWLARLCRGRRPWRR